MSHINYLLYISQFNKFLNIIRNKIPNVPTLRFREHTDEWHKFALSDFVTRITRRNKNNESSLPLTISAQYGLVDQITFFNKTVASVDLSGYYLLYNGDFAYNKSYSNDYAWGAVKRLDRYDKGCLSSLYFVFRPTDKVNSDYLTHYFETSKWHKGISDIAGEGARNHGLLNIAVEDYFATQHYLPSLPEQKKIANFLNLITKRIEVQNKIIKEYKSYRNRILHTIYNDLNDFDYISLNQLCSITTGKLDANAMNPNGKYKFFTCAKEDYYIDKYSFEGESLIISGNGEVGLIKYFNGKFDAYQRTYVLQNFIKNPLYIKFALEIELPKKLHREKNVGAMPYIVLSTLTGIKVKIPNKELISKITLIVTSLDKKIAIEEQILNDYLLQKKYLLANMFI